jgi:hypothetical protein
MRFLEMASPEDQLALWKLVSDKMWAAFAQQLPQVSAAPVKPASMGQGRAATPSKPTAKHLPNAPAKTAKKSTGKPKGRAAKATKAPMAPAPKPLPKPKPLPLSPSETTKQQAQQHQQLAKYLHRAITQSDVQQRIYPQPPTPTPKAVTPIDPMTNGYDERDKDELVMHSRAQHPFKTVGQIKSAFTGQKRGF